MDSNIKKRRIELGLTLEEVGEMCGVGKSTVRKWENGLINDIGRTKIVLLAKALQVSPLFILQEDDAYSFTSQELRLINYYQRLNDIGRKKALDNIKDLSQIPVYYAQETLNAAHAIDGATEEDKKHDDDIMDDDELWK